MSFHLPTFEKELSTALSLYDKKSAETLCDTFIHYLHGCNEELPPDRLEDVLQALRNKRMFSLMQKLGDCYIQMGRQTYKIRRQYAQSLIDLGIYAAPLAILKELKYETQNDATAIGLKENAEATGLIGRICKQQYVNASEPQNPRLLELLKQAIQHYQMVYTREPARYIWHGINLVALLQRAKEDNIELKGLPEPCPIAKEILEQITTMDIAHEATAWDFATAIEACIALDRPDEALCWADKYINTSAADAFEIGSTLRQFREVWRLDMSTPVGQQILPLLNAALLKKEGGSVVLNATDLAEQIFPDAAYVRKLQRVLGNDSFKTYEWYLRGLKACSAVARIGRDSSKGFGTGFLLNGECMDPGLKGQTLLFTNAHVISNDPSINDKSLFPDEAVVTLETVDDTLRLTVGQIIRTSSVNNLDTTILSFDEASREKLKAITDKIAPYALAKRLPAADGKQRVYIIGYPGGGTLQLSLQDNIFLANNDTFLHYRTPTVGGSSGSPVFNEYWELIGIHHAGGTEMEKLDGSKGTYEANEGIAIEAIKKLFL